MEFALGESGEGRGEMAGLRPGKKLVPIAPDQVYWRIRAILLSKACQRINFRFGHLHIDGHGYRRVVAALEPVHSGPNKGKANIPIILGKKNFPKPRDKNGSAGAYAPETDTMFLLSSNYAESSPDEQMLVVHECTHAVIDATITTGSVGAFASEAAAYIAGCLWNLYQGEQTYGAAGLVMIPIMGEWRPPTVVRYPDGDSTEFPNSVAPWDEKFQAAHAAAWVVKDNPGAQVPLEEWTRVIRAVAADPLYAGGSEAYTSNGISITLSAAVRRHRQSR
jgi:hypothetical protein